MMGHTELGNALKEAFGQKGEVLKKIKEQKDTRTDKQKYRDKVEGLPENKKSMEFLKSIVSPMLDDALYDINIKGLKNFMRYKMGNGIYKAVVKERKDNGVVVTIGLVNIPLDDGKKSNHTVDYFIGNKKIDKKYRKGDQLFVNLNLDKKSEKLSIEEFVLHGGDICSVKITNISKKGAFIRLGKYEGFISQDQLDKFTDGKRKMKKGNKILMKIKKIIENNKDASKQWIIWDVVKASETRKNSVIKILDIVNNEKPKLVAAA